ncbi:MAG: permease prefix domain 1-containing protein [Cellulosilyticaceae bacterium]
METIKSYLNNVFSALPETAAVLELKSELLNNMLDKYEELKANGKTENEAIGIVISEFGNIDELVQEMDLALDHHNKDEISHAITVDGPSISLEEANQFIDLKEKMSRLIGGGVTLILIGVLLLVGLSTLIENQLILQTASSDVTGVFPVVIFFLCLAPAVALFVFSGSKLAPYGFIETGAFELDAATKTVLNQKYKESRSHGQRNTIIGVTLCVLSPLMVIIGSLWGDMGSTFGVCMLLLLIAVATNFLIRTSAVTESYKKLLKLEEFSPAEKQQNKMIGVVASIVWPVATCIFLIAGLVFGLWGICWIVFPIVGILFGGFCAVYKSHYS